MTRSLALQILGHFKMGIPAQRGVSENNTKNGQNALLEGYLMEYKTIDGVIRFVSQQSRLL